MKQSYPDNLILIAITIAVAVISFFILKPFINIMLTGMVVAYLSYPLYRLILRGVKNQIFSAFATLIMVVLIITVPLAFLISSVYNEAAGAATSIGQIIPASEGINFDCKTNNESKLCELIIKIDNAVPYIDMNEKIKDLFITLADKLQEWSYKIAVGLSTGIIDFFIMLFVVFFFLIDGEILIKYLKKLAKLKKKEEGDIIKTIEDTTYGVVYGNIVVAIIQGAFAGVGYYFIADMNNPMLFTILTAFFALLPTFGTAIVWVPITLFMIGNGFLTGNYGIVTRGIILAAYCFFFVSLIDNLIKPKIIGTKSGVHPVIIFIGILGGLKFFGITGIIIGPVVLAVLITLLNRFISQEQNN